MGNNYCCEEFIEAIAYKLIEIPYKDYPHFCINVAESGGMIEQVIIKNCPFCGEKLK